MSHHWSTDLPLLGSHARAVVLARSVQTVGRYIVQTSGPGVFAWVQATFEPVDTPGRVALLVPADVEFRHSPVPDAGALTAIMAALYEGLIHRARRDERTWLGGFHARVDALDHHPVDSRPRDYRVAGERALEAALAEAGREVELFVEQRLTATPALAERLDQLARQLGATIVKRSQDAGRTSVIWRIRRDDHAALLARLDPLGDSVAIDEPRVVLGD